LYWHNIFLAIKFLNVIKIKQKRMLIQFQLDCSSLSVKIRKSKCRIEEKYFQSVILEYLVRTIFTKWTHYKNKLLIWQSQKMYHKKLLA
jgi:hypothetical protein